MFAGLTELSYLSLLFLPPYPPLVWAGCSPVHREFAGVWALGTTTDYG